MERREGELFFRRGMRKGVSSIKGIQVLIMPHRISQQTNVVNNQLAKSNFFFTAISLDANNDDIHSVGYADNAQGVLDPRKPELG